MCSSDLELDKEVASIEADRMAAEEEAKAEREAIQGEYTFTPVTDEGPEPPDIFGPPSETPTEAAVPTPTPTAVEAPAPAGAIEAVVPAKRTREQLEADAAKYDAARNPANGMMPIQDSKGNYAIPLSVFKDVDLNTPVPLFGGQTLATVIRRGGIGTNEAVALLEGKDQAPRAVTAEDMAKYPELFNQPAVQKVAAPKETPLRGWMAGINPVLDKFYDEVVGKPSSELSDAQRRAKFALDDFNEVITFVRDAQIGRAHV